MKLLKRTLEIACFNLESALMAEKAGAHRIELCEDYNSGGVTPKLEIMIQAKKNISIPIHVMIRPRGGNFRYSFDEFNAMKRSISLCRENKNDGIVFGILNEKNGIDLERCAEIVDLSKPMNVIFHRAFDECKQSENEIENLISIGVNGILTSGGKGNEIERMKDIKSWQTKFGNQMEIIVGGGIRAGNIKSWMDNTNACSFHSSALMDGKSVADENEIKSMKRIIDNE